MYHSGKLALDYTPQGRGLQPRIDLLGTAPEASQWRHLPAFSRKRYHRPDRRDLWLGWHRRGPDLSQKLSLWDGPFQLRKQVLQFLVAPRNLWFDHRELWLSWRWRGRWRSPLGGYRCGHLWIGSLAARRFRALIAMPLGTLLASTCFRVSRVSRSARSCFVPVPTKSPPQIIATKINAARMPPEAATKYGFL